MTSAVAEQEMTEASGASRKKQHIAILSISLNIGGIERQYVRLANELVKRGFEVDFLLCVKEGKFIEILDPEIKVITLANHPIPRKNLKSLASYFKNYKPDALLAGHDALNVIAIIAKMIARSATRIVTVAHNTLSISWNEEMTPKRRVFKKVLIAIWRKADVIAAVSEGAARSLSSLISVPLGRIEVPYVPIVSDEITKLANEPVDDAWIIDPNLKVVLCVGRIVKEKNLSLLVRSFARVAKLGKCRLILLGDGDDKVNIQNEVKALGVQDWVKMPGLISNPYPYMKGADVLVLSSNREGLPAVLIEGLAVGVPIVSTNCPSGADEIMENGKWGHLIPTNDEDAMVKAISEALTEKHMIRPESYSRFTVENSTTAYQELLVGPPRSPSGEGNI